MLQLRVPHSECQVSERCKLLSPCLYGLISFVYSIYLGFKVFEGKLATKTSGLTFNFFSYKPSY